MTKLLDEIVRAAGQAETIRQKTGFWPVLGHPQVESIGSAMFSDGERADQFRSALEGSYLDKHLRPAMLAFWWEALNLRTILDDEDQEERTREYSESLRDCVDAVAPSSIESEAQFRWELDVAATTRNLPRVLRLLDELKRRPNPEAFSETAVRMLFLLTACNDLEPLLSGFWDPGVQRPGFEGFYRAYSMLAWAVATQPSRVRVPPTPNGPATLREETPVANIRAVREWVELARDSGIALSQEAAAVEAWTTYCLGLTDGRSAELERAGALYENAEEFSSPGGQLDKPWRWEAAATAYQDGGSFAKALSCVERWAELAPGDPRAQRKLAELNWRVGNLEGAINALARAADDEAPSDRAWEQTVLLQLGLEKLSGDSSSKAIERAAERTPLKERGQRLSAWVLPWFDALSEKAKQRFWFGLYAVSSPELLDSTGQATWDNAGDNFGEALAFELKHRVIEPFSAEDAPGKIDSRDEHWVRLTKGRATLGEVIECLLSSVRPTNEAARTLRKRLDTHHKQLLRELTDSEKDLRRLYQLRGDAQHGTLSEAGVRDIFVVVCRVSSQLMDDLGGKPGRRPTNRSNRFEVANQINRQMSQDATLAGPFWCLFQPGSQPYVPQRQPKQPFQHKLGGGVAALRFTETRVGADTPFRIFGTGSVGSQVLTGIPRVRNLRYDPNLAAVSRVWPFETGWATGADWAQETRIVHAEIYPSVRPPLEDDIKDRGQVRAMWHWARDEDRSGRLLEAFAIPNGVESNTELEARILSEEGWILGTP